MMSVSAIIAWMSALQSVSSMTSIFQLGVALNLVVLGYADRRLNMEANIEQNVEENISGINTLHSHLDVIIDSSRKGLKLYDRSFVDSIISKKWDVIQIGVISSMVNDTYYALRERFHRTDLMYRRIMSTIAILCCFGLFTSSFGAQITLKNCALVTLGLIAIMPALVRFYVTSRQTSVYRRFISGDKPSPSSKLALRHARIHRTIEDEARKFAERLERSVGGFSPDKRFLAVAKTPNPTALYFISGQVRARLKTLQDALRE